MEFSDALNESRDIIFTRHFYDAVTVCDALRNALKARRLEEGAFWCLELYQSELYNELLEVLFEVYVCNVAPMASWLQLFIQQTEGITLEGIRSLYFQLYNALENPMPFHVYIQIPSMKQVEKQWKHDKGLLKWLQMDGPQWFDSFSNDAAYVCDRYIHIMALTTATNQMFNVEPALLAWNEWILLTGRRQRRKFAIPQETRSKYRENMDLRHLRSITLRDLVTCPYYNNLFQEMEADNLIQYSLHDMMDEEDEELYQKVHTQVFPDDVPDEWLFIDQNKSHGLILYST